MRRIPILKGDQFGALKVIKEIARWGEKRAFLCMCSCGNKTRVAMSTLRSNLGHCGCIPQRNAKRTHGLSKTPLYYIWNGMMQRCHSINNPAYKNYGGRGITVCKEWHDFIKFSEWNQSLPENKRFRESVEIDRRDNDGNYEPSNCRWVANTINNNNKRNTYLIYFRGKMRPFAIVYKVVSSKYKIPDQASVRYRLKTGWPPKDAFMIPTRKAS
jgi:hypothetical protein